mmetsp:Transcript_5664/g.21448  ORF Transcript_5664/g.21448 Transcript_5664/m.21448 type:complete len:313 (+) Transcript_5664:970-1908(+)
MQKSLNKSQSVSNRAAFLTRDGVIPRKPLFSPNIASPAASAAASPAAFCVEAVVWAPTSAGPGVEGGSPASVGASFTADCIDSSLTRPPVPLPAAPRNSGDTPGDSPFGGDGAPSNLPRTGTYGGMTLTKLRRCPASFFAPVSSSPPPGESSSSSSAGLRAKHTSDVSSYVTPSPSRHSMSSAACVTRTPWPGGDDETPGFSSRGSTATLTNCGSQCFSTGAAAAALRTCESTSAPHHLRSWGSRIPRFRDNTWGKRFGSLRCAILVYALWPSHHALTSTEVHSDFDKHSAKDGFSTDPLRQVFFSGYCKSV